MGTQTTIDNDQGAKTSDSSGDDSDNETTMDNTQAAEAMSQEPKFYGDSGVKDMLKVEAESKELVKPETDDTDSASRDEVTNV